MLHLPVSMPNLPPFREAVAKAVSAENLRSAAARTTDALVLLGLCVLARAGDPVRKDLAEMAVRAKGEYAAIVSVLFVVMDRLDSDSVTLLLERDPDNALGHYLHGALLHVAKHDNEALEDFRKAAACAELRCYDSTVGAALFKAIDALGFEGPDRLCALSWTISRLIDFSGVGFQPV